MTDEKEYFSELLTPNRKLELIGDELGRIQEMIEEVGYEFSLEKWSDKLR